MQKDLTFADKFIYCMELLLIWEVGGCIYYTLEVLFRGYSHVSMYILGGICLVLIGLLNEVGLLKNTYFEVQVLVGDCIVLFLEFVTGCIVNIGLGLHVWDYSNMWGNLLGQICPLFAIIWLPLIALAIYVDDWIKHVYLGFPEHEYIFLFKTLKCFKKKNKAES